MASDSKTWGDQALQPTRLRYPPGMASSILRWSSLLYTAYFFVTPLHRHTTLAWGQFCAFYSLFLLLYYFATEPWLVDRRFHGVLDLFFLLDALYYPFNPQAFGAFVYPFVILAFSTSRLRTLVIVLGGLTVALAVENHLLGYAFHNLEMVFFFCAVLGASNFAYSQQLRANCLLESANLRIEHLTRDAERERIARDLHDLLGHTLTLIAVKLDLAQKLLGASPERARTEVAEAKQIARKALSEVRGAVAGYRTEGLSKELSRARRALLSAGVELTDSVLSLEPTSEHSTVLCLALREAVTNIIRHAQATTCSVQLSSRGECLSLIVADNGRGSRVMREGNGLRGMRERLRALHGELSIASDEGAGTRLEVRLPLATPAASLPPTHAKADTP